MEVDYGVQTSPNSPTSPMCSPRNIELDGELRLMGRSTTKAREDADMSPGSLSKDTLEAVKRSSAGAQVKQRRWASFDIPKIVTKLSKARSANERLPTLLQDQQVCELIRLTAS